MNNLIALLVIVLCASGAFAQTTSPLVCSGLVNNSRVYTLQWYYNYGSNSAVAYSFQRGSQAFSTYGASFPAGTCTYYGSGLSSSEPARLMYTIPTTGGGNGNCYISKVGDGFTCTSTNAVASALLSLANGVSARKTFDVYTSGATFIVTGLSATQY